MTSLWCKQINGIFVSNQTLYGSSRLGSLSLNLLQLCNAQRVIQARKETTHKSSREKENDREGLDWDKRGKTRMTEKGDRVRVYKRY